MNEELINKIKEVMPKKTGLIDYHQRDLTIQDCISALPAMMEVYNEWLKAEMEKINPLRMEYREGFRVKNKILTLLTPNNKE